LKHFLLFVSLLALTACNTDLAQTVAPSGETYETKSRLLNFHGGPDYAQVPAKCQVRAPGFSKTFTTPATIEVPMAKSGRVAITRITCTINGVTKSVDGVPGEYTRTIGYAPSSNLFDFWFYGRNGGVLYGSRDNKVAIVSGAPPP